jgi:hypothetical protein
MDCLLDKMPDNPDNALMPIQSLSYGGGLASPPYITNVVRKGIATLEIAEDARRRFEAGRFVRGM